MEPRATVFEAFRGFAKSSQDFVSGLIHRIDSPCHSNPVSNSSLKLSLRWKNDNLVIFQLLPLVPHAFCNLMLPFNYRLAFRTSRHRSISKSYWICLGELSLWYVEFMDFDSFPRIGCVRWFALSMNYGNKLSQSVLWCSDWNIEAAAKGSIFWSHETKGQTG